MQFDQAFSEIYINPDFSYVFNVDKIYWSKLSDWVLHIDDQLHAVSILITW